MAGHNIGNSQSATVEKLVALVYDKDGHPLFNDYDNIPEQFHHMLTDADWEYIHQMREQKNGDHS